MSSLSPVALQDRIARLLAARERLLLHRPVLDILGSLDRVTARFRDPASLERQAAERQLIQEASLSPAMIRHTLPLLFQEYQGDKLLALLNDEFGDYRRLDEFGPTRRDGRRVCSFPLIVQVLASNIPGAGIDGLIFALLVKSATLVKTASASLSLPLLFAHALAKVDPALAECLAVVTWPGGMTALEEIAFSRADIVMASGSDESLDSIRRRVRGRFIGYGHKVSFSVIGKDALPQARRLAHEAAYDIALFDQQGCLSPQLLYVEIGGVLSPRAFAALLAQALTYWQHELPRGKIPPNASAALRRARDESEWQALSGKETELYASASGTEWTVIYDADPVFVPSPLYRTIRVKPLSGLGQLESLLASWRPYLEAVGVAVGADQMSSLANLLSDAGANRLCPIGAMQLPPLSWRHGGRPRLADLVRWMAIEEEWRR